MDCNGQVERKPTTKVVFGPRLSPATRGKRGVQRAGSIESSPSGGTVGKILMEQRLANCELAQVSRGEEWRD